MSFQFDPEDTGVAKADKLIAWILKRYEVEWCSDHDCEIWLAPTKKKEDKKPDLKLV